MALSGRKTLASVGQNERCFWGSFYVAGAIFGELGGRFEKVDLVLWNCRHFWFWTWWWFRVAGAALRMPRAHFSWQAQYIVDLDKKVAETKVKHRFWHFQCSLFLVRAMLCENLRCARATLSALCARRIALVVAWCWLLLILWDPGKEISWVPEGPPITILHVFHGAVLEVRNIWRSWPRPCCEDHDEILSEVLAWSCTAPYEKILWRSCNASSQRGPCMKILQMPCFRGACMKALLGCSWEVFVARSSSLAAAGPVLTVLWDSLRGPGEDLG